MTAYRDTHAEREAERQYMASVTTKYANGRPEHWVSVYHASGAYETARADCACGWTTGMQDSFAWVHREADRHEGRREARS
jgi:hypothetical protein